MRSRPLQYLGKISYGLYVYHMGAMFVVDSMLTERPGNHHVLWQHIVMSFGLTIAVASVSYAVLEKPFLKLKRRFAFVSSRPV